MDFGKEEIWNGRRFPGELGKKKKPWQVRPPRLFRKKEREGVCSLKAPKGIRGKAAEIRVARGCPADIHEKGTLKLKKTQKNRDIESGYHYCFMCLCPLT